MLKSTRSILQDVLNQFIIRKTLLICFICAVVFSCSSVNLNRELKGVNSILEGDFYNNQFTGILIVNPDKTDTILALNSDKYFIPASNVKIFTLYSGLKLIPDSIPALKYIKQNDTLYFEGTGDPSLIHPFFNDTSALKFLENHPNLVFSNSNFRDTKLGPGWAWEDFEFYFSPERSGLPAYGNVVKILESDSLMVSPGVFNNSIRRGKQNHKRSITENKFNIPENLIDTLEIPFITSNELTQSLLQNELQKPIKLSEGFPEGQKKVLYGMSTDSIYKRMLFESDNFLAEQLMLVASSTLSDSLSFKISRNYILKNQLLFLNQQPRWVDGSGLSRYNLFTPESFVHVLSKLREEVAQDRLFHIFPMWDASGTITKPSTTNETNFIYAKSGGMGNVYNLSGYLITKSGKVFIFSFMNNHFRMPSSEIRQKMYSILKKIHDLY
ncbi:D-alanyl-D-alanine carboxypeptidase [Croceitalea sp. P059]|uniref:D-alanyl-D-alanine carboxypeptidase n=1 Tax=Croceitalea sp. P059 TaxID=3075601 RepID=UPI0028837AC5|nr:D-alanyl-D-alanine carboxypeptidase [Croceitalea sp. P059]MDT0540169.1 D-alanyl-D-alanine carboxypeptidase [Croceitalea sp. P059]